MIISDAQYSCYEDETRVRIRRLATKNLIVKRAAKVKAKRITRMEIKRGNAQRKSFFPTILRRPKKKKALKTKILIEKSVRRAFQIFLKIGRNSAQWSSVIDC